MDLSQDDAQRIFAYCQSRGALLWSKTGIPAGGVNSKGYVVVTVENKRIRAHRIVWVLHHGMIPAGYSVDHKNGDRKDNRLENLRLATASQNACNRRGNADSASGLKGIFFDKSRNRWQVILSGGGEKFRSRRLKTLDEAISICRRETARLHGEFAATARPNA